VLTDATTAEMVKLMENTYRDINIAIANEFARLADRFGVNVWEAIAIANRHPRVKILQPGPGVGGHCISVDPWFFVEAAPDIAHLIHQARLVNDGQPAYVVAKLHETFGDLRGRTFAALGVTYKPDVDDVRESPAIEIVHHLREAGAEVRVFDPYVTKNGNLDGLLVDSVEAAADGAEGLLLLVQHREFLKLDTARLASMMQRPFVFDTRNVLDHQKWQAAGFEVLVLGNNKVQDF